MYRDYEIAEPFWRSKRERAHTPLGDGMSIRAIKELRLAIFIYVLLFISVSAESSQYVDEDSIFL